MGGAYPNGDVESNIPMIFRKARMDTVTWTVLNHMEEEEGGIESGVRNSDSQNSQSGWGEGRFCWLPTQVGS